MPPSRGRRVCRSRLSSGKEPPRGSCSGQTMPRRCSASTTGRWPGDHSHAQFGEASRAGWGRLTGAPALMGQSCTPWWLGVTSLRCVPGPPARWPVLSRRLVPIAHPLTVSSPESSTRHHAGVAVSGLLSVTCHPRRCPCLATERKSTVNNPSPRVAPAPRRAATT
jgi:hypothetical protein